MTFRSKLNQYTDKFGNNNKKIKKGPLMIATAMLLLFTALFGIGAESSSQSVAAVVPANRPNVIYILADDIDRKVLEYMPNVKSLLAGQGTTFDNFIYNIALCCPSRATMLRGQNAHNTKVFSNETVDGGYKGVYNNGLENSTIGTWMKDSGYKTAYYGKYFNGYPKQAGLSVSHIPAGWDDWKVVGNDGHDGFSYRINENGRYVNYGSAATDFYDDVLAKQTQTYLAQNVNSTQPLFMYLAPLASHIPFVPAPRHANLFADVTYPKNPNFNESQADIADNPLKPAALTASQIATVDNNFRLRIREAQALDEMIAGIVNTLQAQGKLDNTVIAFVSDNGFHMGEHRLAADKGGKFTEWEEDIRVPLYIRGPGIAKNVVRTELVSNVDVAPTLAEAGSATIPSFVDGRSVMPLLRGEAVPWRQSVLLQKGPAAQKPYDGLRTSRYTYVHYTSGQKYIYDLQIDPWQLKNVYSTSSQALKDSLANRLQALKGCVAAACRSVEEQPL